jgi:hypothetical protein
MKFGRGLQFAVVFIAASPVWAATPCSGIDRALAPQDKASLAPQIASQLHVKAIDFLDSFREDGWRIYYVETHESDETYVFYSRDPMQSSYVTLWSGAARVDEQQEIKAWVTKNAPGIPPKLAGCFAWHVTKGLRASP